MARDRTGSSIWVAGYPLPGADQRMPGMFAHIRQVHGVDPVGDLARAAQVLPLHAGRRVALLLLARLIQRPDHQAAPPAGTAAPLRPGRRPRTGAPRPSPRRCPTRRG